MNMENIHTQTLDVDDLIFSDNEELTVSDR